MTDRKVGPKARALMHHFESCKLLAYPDPATGRKPYTIGWGMTERGLIAARTAATIAEQRAALAQVEAASTVITTTAAN